MTGTTMRRFTDHTPPGNPWILEPDHAAVLERRTRYPTTVKRAGMDDRVLKSGHNSRKIGKWVTKGKWRDMPIFTLTLEERATCPGTCPQWYACYGNKMHLAQRFVVDDTLIVRLQSELETLQGQHPKGFVVRLHVLGDFPSLSYLRRWKEWLSRFSALHVFGYTAWRLDSSIGKEIWRLSQRQWDRFAVRLSDAPEKSERTARVVTVEHAAGDAIICPAQTDRTDCCATCGLCWQTRRPIAFLEH